MRCIAVLAVLSLLIIVPLSSDSSEADQCSLRLYAVYPTEGFEGFALHNYGSQIDLKDYYVTDGEGKVNFTSSLKINTNSIIFFCKSEPPGWLGFDQIIVYGQNGVTMKGFALADTGDDIYLKKGDQTIDTFVYGDIKDSKEGWKGEPFQKIQKKHLAIRTNYFDNDAASDWELTTPGRTDYSQSYGYDAIVTPISFPDDYSPLFAALQESSVTIDISVYLISHPRIVSSLLTSLSEGVSVRILIEGAPAGGTTSSEIRALKALSDSGAKVKVMKQTDGYRAYGYIHCKYAVIDNHKTIITSENWQESSFESNRGWGAVIESSDYSSYMSSLFEQDYNRQYDVVSFESLYPTAESDTYNTYNDEKTESKTYNAIVTPVISPDHSYDSMKSFIQSAQTRLYSEQLDVDYDWTNEDDNPISWMKGISNLVDCRLIVDVTFDDRNDSDFKDGYGIMDALEGTAIDVKTPVFSGMVHNKGVIADDKVWLGSINWTYNSFKENREAAVIIESKEISDYFSSLFLKDWGEPITPDIEELPLECSIVYQVKGNVILFDVQGTGIDDCTFGWDLDGDGTIDNEGKRIITRMPYGSSKVTLFADNGKVKVSCESSVRVQYESAGLTIPMKYYPIIIICAGVLVYGIIRWSRGRNDPDKRIQRKRSGPHL